MDRIPDRVSTH